MNIDPYKLTKFRLIVGNGNVTKSIVNFIDSVINIENGEDKAKSMQLLEIEIKQIQRDFSDVQAKLQAKVMQLNHIKWEMEETEKKRIAEQNKKEDEQIAMAERINAGIRANNPVRFG